MPTDPPFTAKKKPNVLWWLGGGFVLLIFLFFLQLFAWNPPIVVSPQTTYITAPLGPDGLPDYERDILERSREGVTPDNNAAVLLWPPLWPGELDPKDYGAVATELGLERIPTGKEFLERLHCQANRHRIAKWLSRKGEPTLENATQETGIQRDTETLVLINADSELVEGLIDQAMSRPWTTESFPPLAKWAAANKQPLDQLVSGSRRPRGYFPSPSLLNGERDSLISLLLPSVQSLRESGLSLTARAMWHVGEGRIDEAWRDLLAVHRIGRLTAQGPTMVEQLVGIAIDGIAQSGTLALLDQGQLTAEQARKMHRELAALPNFTSMVDALDDMERLMYLDAVILVGARKDGTMASDIGIGADLSYVNLVSVNWNVALQMGNKYYDRIAAAARLTDRSQRFQALSQIDSDMHALVQEVRQPTSLAAGAISPQRRSELAGTIMLSLFLPAIEAALRAEDRANAMLELTRLAAALAVYRAEHGSYPEKLDELVPGVLDILPVDLFHAKPFFYQRTDGGYLLYSAGENGVDDGGSNELMTVLEGQRLNDLDPAEYEKLEPQIPDGADDYSIRVPTPKWEPPTLPAAEAP